MEKVYSPRDVHALWQLLRQVKDTPLVQDLTKLVTSIFPAAEPRDRNRIIGLGVDLGLVEENSGVFVSTTKGHDFANADHWRLWEPSRDVLLKLQALGLSSCLLPSKVNRPVIFDLFSGAGGLGLAFETEGFTTRVAVDNDPQACDAHSRNFPHCHIVSGDISKIAKSPRKLLCEKYGVPANEVAGIVGGPPCQGFSFIGERVSHDERNLLTSKFMDVVLDIQPKFFVMENVSGLISSGLVPKLGDYIKRLHKNIGVPATEIVDVLPKMPSALAKRDRQFKKRLVSDVISAFKESFPNTEEAIENAIDNAYARLNSDFKSSICKAYTSDTGIAVAALEGQNTSIATIAFAFIVDYHFTKNKQPESALLICLKELASKKFKTPVMQKIINKTLEEYLQAPLPVYYDGVKIGPVLWHLIERASEKYAVSKPTILNAASYGAPQSRERMFLVGIRKDLDQEFVFPEMQYSLPFGKGKKALYDADLPMAPTTYEAIGDLPDVDKFEFLVEKDTLEYKYLSSKYSNYAGLKRLEYLHPSDKSLPRPSWNPFVLDCCKRTLHAPHAVERIKGTKQGVLEGTSGRTRLARDSVSHTLRAGTREGKGSHTAVRPIHYEFNRVITVREGARLMGFPDWMTFHETKWHGFRLVGNGVPSYLARAVAKEIYNLLWGGRSDDSLDEPSKMNCCSNS